MNHTATAAQINLDELREVAAVMQRIADRGFVRCETIGRDLEVLTGSRLPDAFHENIGCALIPFAHRDVQDQLRVPLECNEGLAIAKVLIVLRTDADLSDYPRVRTSPGWCTVVSTCFHQASRGSHAKEVLRSDNVLSCRGGAPRAATNTGTNLTRSATTDTAGEYRIDLLPVGTYQVEVTAQGFKKFRQSGVVLDINRTARVDPILSIGAVTEEITITANTPADRAHGGERRNQ